MREKKNRNSKWANIGILQAIRIHILCQYGQCIATFQYKIHVWNFRLKIGTTVT
jgi:hypothetical protein